MESDELITKVSQILQRPDGSEARITATRYVGEGLTVSVGVYVHRRESPDQEWKLCNDRPHPDWKQMSVDDYKKFGRSEVLQTVTTGEILKVSNLIGKPMSVLDEMEAKEKAGRAPKP